MIRGHGRGGGGRAAPTPRRVLLVTPQSEWGRPHGLITMRELAGGVYEFSWSREYERMHESYEALVTTSADPNMLLELLRHQPCHVGALAQLHEVASHTGWPKWPVNTCAVCCGPRGQHAPGFKEAMLRGEARLRAGHPPNRPYFRALHKHVVALGRRGCHRAALSAATLLLSLDRNDPTRIRAWLDLLSIRASAFHLLYLHSLDEPDACHRYPGWAFSTALAFRELANASSQAPSSCSSSSGHAVPGTVPAAAAAAIPSPPPWANGGDIAQLRRALLMWPSMLPAALNACASNSNAVTALAARWQTAVESAEAAVATAGGGGGAGGGPTSARAVATNGGQAHLEALYWERANELWKEPARIGWLQQVASSLLNELIAAVAARPDGGGTGGGKGGGHGEGGGVLTEFRELREQARRFYPPGGGNPFRGLEFTTLRAEQVVIPEEEQLAEGGQQQQAWDGGAGGEAVDVGDEAAAEGGGGDGGVGGAAEAGIGAGEGTAAAAGGGGAASLAPLEEEAEALTRRVEEMERLTKGGGAAHLRAMITQRLGTLDERLTKQMIDIDAAQVEGEAARAAKRSLTRRMDELCTRVAAIEM